MKSFRLQRLLSLRKDQEKADKIRWALAEREALEADARVDASAKRVESARQELADSHTQEAARSGSAMAATVCAYDAIDALTRRVGHDEAARTEARRRALDARLPYDERRREVEALRRLEERWTKERRRQRRRKENREREAFINSQSTPITHPAPTSEPA